MISPRQIEQNTGFAFFTAVPANIAAVFRAKVDGLPAPGITNVSPTSGSAGSSVVIKGTNFTGASFVWFNGSNAVFTLNSSNQITTAVPEGATTGPVSVIAPGGLATSAGNFTVSNPAIAPSITSVTFVNNQFAFTLTGTAGSNYIVQASTNLTATDWISIFTNSSPFTFTDTNASYFNQRFYRTIY